MGKESKKAIAEKLFAKAGKAFEMEDFRTSADLLETVTELDSGNIGAWLTRAAVLDILRRDEESLMCAESAIKLDPKNAEGWLRKGIALLKMLKGTMAIDAFDNALEITKKNHGVWYYKGIALSNQKNFKGALNCFEEAEKLAPKDIEIKQEKGRSLEGMGKLKGAMKCYNDIIKLDPKSAAAWYGKAVINFKEGNIDAAIECIEKASDYADQQRNNELLDKSIEMYRMLQGLKEHKKGKGNA